VSPVAVNKEINILEPLSGDFVGVVSNAEHLYTNVSVSGANMMLDTEERIDCEIVPKNFVDGIDASKNIIINGKINGQRMEVKLKGKASQQKENLRHDVSLINTRNCNFR
jgi:hypothetical protein